MIGYLRGNLLERRSTGETAVELVVDVAGVGYRVAVSPRTAALAEGLGHEIELSVHTHVREGAITLYGFGDAEERRSFELLLSAHGVGPSLALAIVAVHRPRALVEIVVGGDVDSLTLVPGVGRKTAQRLLVDLRSRFEDLDPPAALESGPGSSTVSARADVSEALAQLGYGAEEIRRVLRLLPEGTTDVEELLKLALKDLAPARR